MERADHGQEPSPAEVRGLKPIRGLVVAQALGAFNDNAWKQFVILLAAAEAASEAEGQESTAWAQIALMVPLLLVSLPAGMLADRVSKRTVILGMKSFEILVILAGTAALAANPHGGRLALGVLCLLGVQAALFSPAKYGILPELLSHERLSAGNGVLETFSNVGILAGVAGGGFLITLAGREHVWRAGLGLAALAVAGLAAAWTIPRVGLARPEGGLVETIRIGWQAIRADRVLRLALMGQLIVWSIALLVPPPVQAYAKETLGLQLQFQSMPMAAIGIGVGVGSLLAGWLSAGKVEYGLIPLGALGLTLSTMAFALVGPGVAGTVALMAILGVSSGLVFVPLSAILQWRSPADRRGAVIALANLLVYGGMLGGSIAALALARAGVSARGTFLIASIVLGGGFVWSLMLVPDALLRFVLLSLASTLYRVRVIGRSNVPAEGGALLAPNRVSFADGQFLIASIDRPIRFVVYVDYFHKPFIGWMLRSMRAIPISGSGGPKMILAAFREAGRALDQGDLVCIFPEGQLTRTGLMAPFQRGLERIVKGRTTPLIPVHLDRLERSIFSPVSRYRLPRRIPLPVTVSFGAPIAPGTPVRKIRRAIRDLDQEAWAYRKADCRPLHHRFIDRARTHPFKLAYADLSRPSVRSIEALAGAIALARKLAPSWRGDLSVAILLPASVGCAVANLAAAIACKTVVNLNFTAGKAGMESAIAQAGPRIVITSRQFLAKAKLEAPAGVQVVMLEEVLEGITRGERLWALLAALFATKRRIEILAGASRTPTVDDPATIIFSSGSTGEPKGVVLSHFNITANLEAIGQVFQVLPNDRLMGVLPLFHSFGFTLFWFAAQNGIASICHPSPLDAAVIGGLVERYRATILLATPTFLQLYLRRCTPAQFGSLRLVLVGAERLPEALALAFEDAFGLRPLEGYGLTECSPVVAVNTFDWREPGYFQPGARRGYVGQPLPGVSVRIVDPESLAERDVDEPGLVLVKGPNVMRGYLGRDDLTAAAFVDGWYNTGDMGLLSEDGFLKITGRLSRFSKIGGEMVPHGRIEEALHQALGATEQVFAVTAVGDEKKGERLVVLHVLDDDQVARALAGLAEQGLPNLFIPRRDSFVRVPALPMLGSGKLDLRALKAMAVDSMASRDG